MTSDDKKLPGWLRILLVGGTMATLWWLERRRPLRRQIESPDRHDGRNLVLAALASATVQHVEQPLIEPLCRLVDRHGWGILKRYRLPRMIETAMAVLMLDYTLYLWHVLNHRVPLLWRFHQPHHVDRDLTTSTALRFHAGELALSTGWRAGQVVLIGVSPLALAIWQTLTLMEIMFHHANVRVPAGVERYLRCLVMTPHLHGIHHSIVKAETNSNWSSGLTLWDWLHGTLRLDISSNSLTIGVPAYQAAADVTLPKLLAMPLAEQRDSWSASTP